MIFVIIYSFIIIFVHVLVHIFLFYIFFCFHFKQISLWFSCQTISSFNFILFLICLFSFWELVSLRQEKKSRQLYKKILVLNNCMKLILAFYPELWFISIIMWCGQLIKYSHWISFISFFPYHTANFFRNDLFCADSQWGVQMVGEISIGLLAWYI